MATNPFTADIIGWAMAAQRVYQIPASLNLSAAKLESNLGPSTLTVCKTPKPHQGSSP